MSRKSEGSPDKKSCAVPHIENGQIAELEFKIPKWHATEPGCQVIQKHWGTEGGA